MNAAHFSSRLRSYCSVFFGPVLFGNCVLLSSVSLRAQSDDASQTSDEIECITPDGRLSAISRTGTAPGQVGGAVAARDTIICNLQEGLTIFIIPFPNAAQCDRFTFVNENAAACGEFEIAVSDARLAADSPGWIGVEGIVPFAHKRLFNLSMLGINARYIKLLFRVENTPGVACVDDVLKQQLVGNLNITAAGPEHPLFVGHPSVSMREFADRVDVLQAIRNMYDNVAGILCTGTEVAVSLPALHCRDACIWPTISSNQ